MLILGKNDNASKNFGPHKNKKSILKEQEIKRDYRNLKGKSLDTKSCTRDGLLGHTFQARFLASESLSSLKEIRFDKPEFSAIKFILNIKYHQPRSLDNNLFYLFNNQLDDALANFFAKFKIRKNDVKRFLSNLLIA